MLIYNNSEVRRDIIMLKKEKTVQKYSIKPSDSSNKSGFRFNKIYILIIIPVLVLPAFYYFKNYYIYKDIKKSGHEYILQNDYDNAIKAYGLYINQNPEDPGGYYNRGTVYLNKKDYDSAIEDLNTAIKMNPKSVHFYMNRASAYFMKGDYENSIKDNSKVIELSPDNSIAYYSRGRGFYHSGKREEALKDFEKACSLGAVQAKGLIDEIKTRLNKK